MLHVRGGTDSYAGSGRRQAPIVVQRAIEAVQVGVPESREGPEFPGSRNKRSKNISSVHRGQRFEIQTVQEATQSPTRVPEKCPKPEQCSERKWKRQNSAASRSFQARTHVAAGLPRVEHFVVQVCLAFLALVAFVLKVLILMIVFVSVRLGWVGHGRDESVWSDGTGAPIRLDDETGWSLRNFKIQNSKN
jgi:hypothetical protein